MKSRWSHLKDQVLRERRRGRSMRELEAEFGIPRSTLSGWFKSVQLSPKMLQRLERNHATALKKARERAAVSHRNRKLERLTSMQSDIQKSYSDIDRTHIEIALAMLYLGEGAKSDKGLVLASSNAKILQFYIGALESLYDIPRKSLRAGLHLRADQDEVAVKKYWVRATGIPVSRFQYVIKDKRTIGRPTYMHYKGVCSVGGGGVEIQRRLMYLAEVLCSRAINKKRG